MQRRAPQHDYLFGAQLCQRQRVQQVGRPGCGGLGDGRQMRKVLVHPSAVTGNDDGIGRQVDGQRLIEAHRRCVCPRLAIGSSGRDIAGIRIRFGHKGFTQRDIELHRSGVSGTSAAGGCQYPAGRRAPLGVEPSEIGAVLSQSETDRGANLGAEIAQLLHGLVGAGAQQFVGPVCAQHDERHPRIVGLDDGRSQVGHRRAGCHGDRNRTAAPGRQADSEKAGGALVDADVQAHPARSVGVGQSERQRCVARPGAQHDITDAAANEFVDDDPGLSRRGIHA